jgi:DNA-binding transcriptional MerR regulator
MSERILTLFGEEILPEQVKPVAKSRARNKKEEIETDEKKPDEEQEKETAKPLTDEKVPDEKQKEEIAPRLLSEEKKPDEKERKKPEQKIVNEQPGEKQEEESVQPIITGQEKEFVIPEDWKGDKQYYTIGEVAELFKVKTSHIRFWTNEFKIKVRTTRKGDRLFTAGQIRELRAIHHLVKERGFTLSGAKAKMKSQNKMDVEVVDLRQSLLQLRSKLLIIRNQLI